MNALGWLITIAVLAIVIVLVLLAWLRGRRRGRLRDRFGPEYDRAVREGVDRRATETHLAELSQRRETLDIKELDPRLRADLGQRWQTIQERFVDEPAQAVADADGLVTSVLRERGYPVGDFDDRAALLATDHPQQVQGYRAAHAAHVHQVESRSHDTEKLRQAMIDYRAVFQALAQPVPGAQPQSAAPPVPEAVSVPEVAAAAASGDTTSGHSDGSAQPSE